MTKQSYCVEHGIKNVNMDEFFLTQLIVRDMLS
jgi:hypothetical protein